MLRQMSRRRDIWLINSFVIVFSPFLRHTVRIQQVMSLNSADTAGGTGGGSERAPRLVTGDFAGWQPRMESYLMRVGALSACTTERINFAELSNEVRLWDTQEEERVLARMSAIRAARAADSAGTGVVSSQVSGASGSSGASPVKAATVATVPDLSDEDKSMRKAVRELVARSQRAYGILYECIPEEMRQQSEHIPLGYAYGLWHWLETKLQPSEQGSINELLGEFFAMTQGEDETFDAYRARVNKIDTRLTAAKNRPPRAQYAYVLMDRLQPRFHAAVLALKANGTLINADAVDWDKVATLINQHGRNEEHMAVSASSGKVMAAMRGRGRDSASERSGEVSGGSGHNGAPHGPRTSVYPFKCFRCNKVGHKAYQCDQRRQDGVGDGAPGGVRENQNNNREYAAAATRGHSNARDGDVNDGRFGFMLRAVDSDDESDCGSTPSVERASSVERAMAVSDDQAGVLKRLVRGNEAASGTLAMPAGPAAPAGQAAQAAQAVPAARAPAAKAPAAARRKTNALGAGGNDGRRATQSITRLLSTHGWLVDSGASMHITGNKDVFETLPRRCAPVKIEVADGAFVVTMMKGSVRLRMRNAADTRNVSTLIENVYYHDRFNVNLLSWGTLKDLGWKLNSDSTGSVVTTPGNNQIALRTGERVLVLEGCAPERVYSALGGDVAVTDSRVLELQRMHERLGHVGFDRMMQLIKVGKTRGLDKFAALNDTVVAAARKLVLECRACIEGKGTRTPFGHDGLDKGAAPFEVIHMDTFEVRKTDGTPVYAHAVVMMVVLVPLECCFLCRHPPWRPLHV